jgi:outer membrane lipoprotein-sorting protein
LVSIVAVTLGVCAGCLVRRHKLDSAARPNAPLLTASLDELTGILRERYDSVETLNATVDLEPALLSASKGEIAEYKDVLGYILFRKPSSIRVIALYPVVRTTAFDMVSDGHSFRLYLPAKNLFLIGLNRIEKPSPKKLENLRPEHLLDALLIRPPDPPVERAVFENWTEGSEPSYIVHIIRGHAPGRLDLVSNIWFDRASLEIRRQQVFDEQGNITSDARYGGWERRGGVLYPKQIIVTRPKDEYELSIRFDKTTFNQPVSQEKFDLPEPPGVKVEHISGDASAKPSGGGGGG